jgi:hypothetical protein
MRTSKKGERKTRNAGFVMGYRLGLYDPDPDSSEVEWITTLKRPTRSNLAELKKTVAEYNKIASTRPDVLLSLGIFAVGR